MIKSVIVAIPRYLQNIGDEGKKNKEKNYECA